MVHKLSPASQQNPELHTFQQSSFVILSGCSLSVTKVYNFLCVLQQTCEYHFINNNKPLTSKTDGLNNKNRVEPGS